MKIGIIGTGQVGAACAFSCVLRRVGTQLMLVDHNPDLARAQAEDIAHAAPFSEAIPVQSGDIADLDAAGIVMIAAGVPQKDASESRLDLLKRNADVFEAVIPQVLKAAPDAILLVASNPVDIMSDVALSIAANAGGGIDRHKVIGSGTILDTARFRQMLATRLGVSSHSVHAYVLGEHGDSEVLHWSGVSVGAIDLDRFTEDGPALDAAARAEIDDSVRNAAYRIIAGKGATWFGIGTAMARIAETIIGDERAVLTVAARADEVLGVSDVTLSLPRVMGRHGVERTIMPRMTDEETAALRRSAEVIRAATDAVKDRA